MKKIAIVIFTLTFIFTINVAAFPIPKDNKVIFDIIRKNKVIGTHKIKFIENDKFLLVETNININVKILFIPAYKFSHYSVEKWINEDFIEITGHTNFEDEREYFINGYENNNSFIAQGMDGKLTLNNKILPSNFWNINMLNQKEIFDTQKGIVREIDVKDLGDEEIIINEKKINCKKFTLNASSNPKDKGPFPEYTLWYDHKDELMKFKFINWRDKKVVTLIRKLQEED